MNIGYLQCRANLKIKEGRRVYVVTITDIHDQPWTFEVKDTSILPEDPPYLLVDLLRLGEDWAWVALPISIFRGQVPIGHVVHRNHLRGEEKIQTHVSRLPDYFPIAEETESRGKGRPKKSPPPENSEEWEILVSELSKRKKAEALNVDPKTLSKWLEVIT